MVHTTKKGSKGIRLTAKEADARSARNIAAAKAKGKKVTTRPKIILKKPIKAEKEKKGIAKFREKKTIAGRATKVLTSTKTTAALATTLATIVPAGRLIKGAGTIGKATTATITATVSGHKLIRTVAGAEKLVGFGVRSATRNFVGKPAIPKTISKLFHAVRPTASRFANNAKSQGLTKSLLSKGGLSLGAASILVGAIGSYPFAGFIKEEAIQTLGFAFNTAERNNDVEGMESAIAETDEILNNAPSVLDKVPYANVLVQLKAFYKAAAVKLENDRTRLETLRGEQEAGETAFAAEQAESRQRTLENRAKDAEYFQLIREGKFEEADELLQAELKGGN